MPPWLVTLKYASSICYRNTSIILVIKLSHSIHTLRSTFHRTTSSHQLREWFLIYILMLHFTDVRQSNILNSMFWFELTALYIGKTTNTCWWWLILPIQNDAKKTLKNNWNPSIWLFIWEYSVTVNDYQHDRVKMFFYKIFASLCFGRK